MTSKTPRWKPGFSAAWRPGAITLNCGLSACLPTLVSQRTREIGIRMALGAQHGHVFGLVMRHAALLIRVGLFVGVAGGAAGDALNDGYVVWSECTRSADVCSVVLLLTLVALAACLVPVRRATGAWIPWWPCGTNSDQPPAGRRITMNGYRQREIRPTWALPPASAPRVPYSLKSV